MSTTTVKPEWTRKDFASDQDVRWCPGCGDYVILSAVHRALANLGKAPHEHVFISGIGCSSRFPYYMGTYGFHTIHGRAPALASGVKAARPDLNVWVVTGDGDGLSIGANHLLHLMRRNIDINILLFNNRIYGLTKGQYSPCSEQGKVTKTSPLGSIEQPINALSFAMASQATFLARTFDSDPKHMTDVLQRACEHKGTSFVEIYQNCKIFNDGAHADVTDKEHRSERVVFLEHGKPLVFGALGDKGLTLSGVDPVVVNFDPASPPDDLLVHDEQGSAGFGYLLTRLEHPGFPEPMGVFRSATLPVYEDELHSQIEQSRIELRGGDLKSLFRQGAETWTIEPSEDEEETMAGEISGISFSLDDGLEEKDSYAADLDNDAVEPLGVERVLASPLADVPARTEAVTVSIDASVRTAIDLMLSGGAVATLLVTGPEDAVVGLVTEHDLLHRLPEGADLEAAPISIAMTPDPEWLDRTDSIAHALNFMGARGYRRVLVRSETGPAVVLTVDDVLDRVNRPS